MGSEVVTSKKQLSTLFICSLIPWTVGNGLNPLLPVYAGQLGASSTMAGLYLAVAFITLTLGALAAGWVYDKLQQIKLPLIICGIIMIPIIWLISQVHNLGELVGLTALLWFAGGLELALISILAGLSAGANERGKIFGILAATSGLGAVIGAFAIGWLVDHWGYSVMFKTLAIFTCILPVASLPLEEKGSNPVEARNKPEGESHALDRNFYWLFAATILFTIPIDAALLIRSLVMDAMGFSSLEITSTGAISGLVAIPFPFILGWISDRIGRKTFLYATYLLGFVFIVILAASTQFWHFLLAFAIYGIATGAYTIGNALVTDLVPRESLGRGLSTISAALWIGGVIGYGGSGILLQGLGLGITITIVAIAAIAAVALLVPIRTRLQPKQVN